MSLSLQVVHVNLGPRSYDIQIGSGNLSEAGNLVRSRREAGHVVVVTDDHVDPLYADPLANLLAEDEFEVDVLVVDPGEQSKSPDVAAELWERMLDAGTDRSSVVVAVGGGVVGDLAGFAAATFGRGLDFLQVPTTLLAQVDSSVGGKVGINLPDAKNMVGAFWQPIGVLVDVDVLATLPDREYRAGLAEVVKYGVIRDAELFQYLEDQADAINRRDPAVLQFIIERCCRIKADVVEADEREESGLRAILNYGHTFCHALEAATGYDRLLHGEGVAIGMLCASRLAERLGRITAELTRRQHDLLQAFGLPTTLPQVSHDELLERMYHDKKTDRGRLRFVLPTKMGHVELVGGIDEADIRAALVGSNS